MTMRGLIWFSSDVCRNCFEHPFLVRYLSLAALGLQAPGISHQPYPGFLTHRAAPGTLLVSTYSNEDAGTLVRYSAEDECGA
jgi:hypothetical protein